jgi:hypothetical protein
MAISCLVGLVLFRKSRRGMVARFSSLLVIDIFLMYVFFGV